MLSLVLFGAAFLILLGAVAPLMRSEASQRRTVYGLGAAVSLMLALIAGFRLIQGGPIASVSLDPTPTEAANAINALLAVLRSQNRLAT